MTIIVFLVDTSASMNQRIFLGGRPTLLDVAKSAVEYFVKVRQRSPEARGDRYMLMTFEDPPLNLKAGWKENLSTFNSELKNLTASGLTTLGTALKHTFDILNVNRMQHGIDTYGQGRSPFYLEPSIVLVITDGGRLCASSGVTDEIKFQGVSPGFELTREPYRWDQRIFGLVLKMSGQPTAERDGNGLVPPAEGPIEAMCDSTGGRSYAVTTHRILHQVIESIAQKVVAGVVLHLEKWGLDPAGHVPEEDDTKWHSTRKLIQVPRSAVQKGGFAGGFWPIPESFWPDPSLPSLPPRSAHPGIKFTCLPQEPLVLDNFPFDKYEFEPNPLTQFILARKMVNVCWQVFLPNSARVGGLGLPFGYLKASSNLTSVNLFVMPYNYPVLLPLLQDLQNVHRFKPSGEWKAKFGFYLSTIPPYYLGPLKRAMLRIGAGVIGSSIMEESYLSHTVLSSLKKLKTQSKAEFDRTCADINERVLAKEALSSLPIGRRPKNPFDIPRDQLLSQLAKLRAALFRSPSLPRPRESLHSQPIQQMGNYQEYLKRLPSPLRPIETTPTRQHMFGNPFKMDKRIVIDKIDEADVSEPAPDSAESVPHLKAKRKPGPLPRAYHFRPMRERGADGSSLWAHELYQEIIVPPPAAVGPISDPDPDPEDSVQIYPDLDDDEEEEEEVIQNHEDEEVKVKSPDPPPKVEPEVEDEAAVFEKNLAIRTELHKEIRRPIVRMDLLLGHLHSIAGTYETKRKFVKGLEKEALRFKRRKLAQVFQEEAEAYF